MTDTSFHWIEPCGSIAILRPISFGVIRERTEVPCGGQAGHDEPHTGTTPGFTVEWGSQPNGGRWTSITPDPPSLTERTDTPNA